jgi:hypothetical protein
MATGWIDWVQFPAEAGILYVLDTGIETLEVFCAYGKFSQGVEQMEL